MRIGVIGTGVAGSLFIAAARDLPREFAVRGFDRISSNTRDEAGTGLNVGPNAIKALRLNGGLCLGALRSVSLPWRRWLIALTDGTKLIDLNMLDIAEEPGIRIRWADLYGVLRAESAASTLYDRALEGLEEDSGGRLVPVFRDSSGSLSRDGAFDLLVAADGRYSRVRELIDGIPKTSFPGIGTWRVLVRGVAQPPFDDYGQYFCGNARLLSFRLAGDAVYIAGSFPIDPSRPVPDELRTAAAQRSFFEPRHGKSSVEVRWMLEKMEQHVEEINWARTQEIEIKHQLLNGRVLLLGDAAHAMFQTLGQGATQSIEDAVAAANVIRAYPAAPGAICDEYQNRRCARVKFACDFTRDATDTLLPGGDPVAGSLKKAEAPFVERLRRLYRDVAC
jgi:salicylate hydroxylase